MAFTGNQQITQTSSSLTDATLTEFLTVSLEGTVRNGRISDFIVTSVDRLGPDSIGNNIAGCLRLP